MKRRTAACFLIVVLLGTMISPTVAAQSRDTEFFTEQYHTALDFDQIEYRRIDPKPLLEEADAVRALLPDAGNLEEVTRRHDALIKQWDELSAMSGIAYIRFCQNYTDTAAEEESAASDQALSLVSDKMSELARDILNSPCASAADKHYSPKEREELLAYVPKTEEQLALEVQETDLINRYWTTSGDITVVYDGRSWDLDSAKEARDNGEIDKDTYKTIKTLVNEQRNEELGTIFLEMIGVRRQMAALAGYDDYTQYAYQKIWDRDYTPEEIRPFHGAVKEYVAPLMQDMGEIYDVVLDGAAGDFVFDSDYSGDLAVNAMEPYLPQLSDELVEAFDYMRSHGLYDLEKGDLKQDQGYCITLDGYGALFIYNKPYGGVYDLQALIHEFGHYNSGYWADPRFSKSSDISEVHSQGLELLFTKFYPELFGQYSDAAKLYLMDGMIYSSIANGARMDELQQYAYATENVTLEQLNREYCRLSKEYGYIDADDPREELGTWVDIHHLFTRPCEYICYAVSASGAFTFWLEAQEDYLSAVDHYLQLVALDTAYSFRESFQAVGVDSPISPEYVEKLAKALRVALEVDEQVAAIRKANGLFSDVDGDAWYAQAVAYVCQQQMMQGIGEDAFGPENTISRGSVIDILYRMEGSPAVEEIACFSDVAADASYDDAIDWAASNQIVSGFGDGTFRPEQAISREQAVTVLWNYARYKALDVSTGESTSIRSFDDSSEVAGYAVAAMQWACGSGVVCGMPDPDGEGMILQPAGEATRAQMAAILMHFCRNSKG